MTIYIDIVFIENLIMNYIIIISTAIITKNQKRYIRILIASIIGAIYTVITYFIEIKIYINIISKIILSIIIVYISFTPQKVNKMLKDMLFFYIVSFMFGGVALSLISTINSKNLIIIISITAIIACSIIIISSKIINKYIKKEKGFCNIKIYIDKKVIETRALVDSGNLLKEPITNNPVIIVEKDILYKIIPKEILEHAEEILRGDINAISNVSQKNYQSRLRFIPFSSLGKSNGMILGVKSDYIEIIKDNDSEMQKNTIIGIYNNKLSKKGEYKALIGIGL